MMGRYTLVVCLILGACGGGDDDDAGDADAGYPPVTTAHCDYEPVAPTAGAGGSVTAGALEAGAAERLLRAPIGTALGSYTARAGFLGTAGKVDLRQIELPGAFNPSVGIEHTPRVKALALSAGGETILILKIDIGYLYEGLLFDLEQRLGTQFSGKILLTGSHSHSAWGQYSGHTGIGGVGSGVRRNRVYDLMLDAFEDAARAALDDLRPARIGFYLDDAFDPDNGINRDRRGANDELAGGPRDDHMLFMIRVDAADGAPIAALPVVGLHGTLQDSVNSFASTDAPGAIERFLEERFDDEVVVMHLQGATGDVSPVGHGGVDCDEKPGDPDHPCWEWIKNEGHGMWGSDTFYAAWEAAGADMVGELEIEMMLRSVPLGPDPSTFTIRDGALAYAPWDRYTPADRVIYATDGTLASPIDEFNAPVGAALCEADYPLFPEGLLAGTDELPPYGSCVSIDVAGDILGQLLDLPFEAALDRPICQSTRTNVTALRLGDYVIGALPGEVTTLVADTVRAHSPVAADKTIVLGFSNGHIGYLLTPEDWVLGEYESSINFWGPLEGEYLAERVTELMALTVTPEREDAAAGGADRVLPIPVDDDAEVPLDVNPPGVGTVPTEVSDRVFLRSGAQTSAQPPATVPRVSGLAHFIWIGDDPLVDHPRVTLERDAGDGAFEPVLRRSGRAVEDGELLVTYTPLPLRREGDDPRTHYYAVEWQAVPWLGADGLHGLDGRAGVPLGDYRFHVEGTGYELWSEPFEVVTTPLAVRASRSGTTISGTVELSAPKGYRLLHLQLPSNRPVPQVEAVYTVVLTLDDMTTVTYTDVQGDANGAWSLDAGDDAARVTRVRATDPFGNTGADNL